MRRPTGRLGAGRLPAPTEAEEQIALFDCIKLRSAEHPVLGLVHMIPNGARLQARYKQRADGTTVRISREGELLKRMGLLPGIPDLFCPVARHPYHGLYIELKRLGATPSDTRPEQHAMHAALTGQGYLVLVCCGWTSAWNALVSYLGLHDQEVIP